jgi:Na+/H+-translocating membrane pyrophosphatase
LFLPLSFGFPYLTFPDSFTAGTDKFAQLQIKAANWESMAYCIFMGNIAGFLIALISEFFTSCTCPPAKDVTASCKKGHPWNIIKASSYGNFVSVLIIGILGTTLMESVNIGGGIGLAFTLMTLIGYLTIFGVLKVSGGVCASALRITKYIKM